MSVTEHTLTYDFADITGDALDPRHTVAWVETNVDGDVVVDTGTSGKVLAGAKVIVSKDIPATAGTVDLPTTAGATNPTGFQYRVWLQYRSVFGGKVVQKRWNSGWFSFTASANLKDIIAAQYVPPTYGSALMTQLDAHEAGLEDDLTAHSDTLCSALTQAGLGNFDEAMVVLDDDDTSAFRVQQDARTAALIGIPIDTSLTGTALTSFFAALDDGADTFIPPGQSWEPSPFTLTKPVTIRGPGGLKDPRTAPTTPFITITRGASGTVFSGCPIEGVIRDENIESHSAFYITGNDNGAGNAPDYVTDVVIDVPKISGFGAFAIRHRFAQDGTFLAGDVSYTGGGGFFGESERDNVKRIEHLHHIAAPVPGSQTYGIQSSRKDNSTDLVRFPRSSGGSSHIEVCDDCPDMHMIGTHGGKQMSWSFDTALGVKLPFDVAASQGDDGEQLYAAKDIVGYGKYCNSGVKDGSSDRAFSVAGANKTIGGALTPIDYASGIRLHIDELVGYGHESDIGSGGVMCRDTWGLQLSIGIARQCSPAVVCLYHDNQDFTIDVGTVEDVWSNTLPWAAAVSIVKNTNKGTIRAMRGTRGPAWKASETVSVGSIRKAPGSGARIQSTADRTTGATYDATEATFWTATTSVNTHGVRVDAAPHANTDVWMDTSFDPRAFDTKVSGKVSGMIPWLVGQIGYVVDGTLVGRLYNGGLLLEPGFKIMSPASTTSGAGLQITSGAEPTNPFGGDVWIDSAQMGTQIGGFKRRIFTGYEATATLDFPSIAAGSSAELTVSINDLGAVGGDVPVGAAVILGPPATLEAGLIAQGRVTSAGSTGVPGTVTIRLHNFGTGASDPASAAYKPKVIK